jgi:hypothetical protein
VTREGLKMDKTERMALAVNAEVAAVRAQQAHERHAGVIERAAPLYRAMEDLRQRYGENMDPGGHVDEFRALVAQHGGADIKLDEVMGLMTGMQQALADHENAAAEAFKALSDAMGEGNTVLEWVGCTDEEFTAAVEAAVNA